MATISPEGISSTDLSTYKILLQDAFKNALGSDLDVDAQTPQGQIIGIFALALSVLDDQIVLSFQQLNIFAAAGTQLDAFGATFNITRTEAQKSSVTANLAGVPTTVIPSGSQAKTTSGDIFLLAADATISAGGSIAALFEAQENGAVAIDAGTLTQIVSVVPGWETVTNPSTGIVGQTKQSDFFYRQKYFSTLAKNAEGTIAAIQAAVEDIVDVESVMVEENDTSANKIIQEITLLPHSIAVVVEGSSAVNEQQIGDTIYIKKTAGADTAGADTGLQTSVTVPTNAGVTSTIIYFYPVQFVTLEILISIKIFTEVPDVIDRIKANIISFFAGTLEPDLAPIDIADSSYLSRLYIPVNKVQGFDTLSLTQQILTTGSPEEVITPKLNERLIVDIDDIGVTIVP